MKNKDIAKLEKLAQQADELNDEQLIQFSIAISLQRIAERLDNFYDNGMHIAET